MVIAGSATIAGNDCSSSEMEATEVALYNHAGALNACTVDLCEEACMSSMQDATSDLPDCDYVEGLNYFEIMSQSVQACELQSSGSEGSNRSFTSATASNSTSATVSDCSQSELTTTSVLLAQNSDALATNCGKDLVCSTECIAIMTNLVYSLPNCAFYEGVSYHDTFNATIAGCSADESTFSSYAGSNYTDERIVESCAVELVPTALSAFASAATIGLLSTLL